MADERAVTFDESYRVRVLDSEKYNQTQNLAEGARDFCDKVSQLNDIVKSVVEAVDHQAARTEAEKLRAVGKRNQVSAEAEMRKRKKAETAALFMEKQAEIHRLQAEYDSLLKAGLVSTLHNRRSTEVKAEQELLIAKLSDSSA